MATTTTYYDIVKPAYGDPLDVAVLNNNSDIIDSTLHDLDVSVNNSKVLVVPCSVPANLPYTENFGDVTNKMVVVNYEIGNQNALQGVLTVTTEAGTITFTGSSGTIASGGLDITLYLEERQ